MLTDFILYEIHLNMCVCFQIKKKFQHDFIVAHEHSMSQPIGFEFVSYKYFEFLVYGRGISNEKLSIEDRKRMDNFRDFEFN